MKDCLIRAIKTFVQAFLGVLIPKLIVILEEAPNLMSLNLEFLYALLPAALAAGISAIWNIWLLMSREQRENEESEGE
jgi:hypothetical protein